MNKQTQNNTNENIRNTHYINLPNSEKYIINCRNEKLHTRHVFTDKLQLKAIIICLHGYGSHINRFIYKKLYENFTQHNYAFIGLDWILTVMVIRMMKEFL